MTTNHAYVKCVYKGQSVIEIWLLQIPNFYYWAANLHCIANWTCHHLNTKCPIWATMETTSCLFATNCWGGSY